MPLPEGRKLDSYDLTPVLKQTGKSNRNALFYYRGYDLMAVRHGPWKLHLKTQTGYGGAKREVHNPPLLFNLEEDPGESRNLAKQNPAVIESIQKVIEAHQKEMVFADSQLEL